MSDSRVPVINLEDGSRLSGEDAPLKKNLESWLEKHPGHVVDSRVDDLEEGEIVRTNFYSCLCSVSERCCPVGHLLASY